MDTTFSDDEKRFVLGEMIKVSTVDISTLVDFIRAHQVEPNWMSMQLPGGRNMNQCFGAVENMFQTKLPPPNLTSFKRKSLSDLVDHPAKRQAMMGPLEPPLAPARAIQPRIPHNGYPSAVPVTISPPVTSTGKKRGRPSKADKEAQARAVYSRLTEYPPITPAPSAPAAVQVPREYATSPRYEYSSNLSDQKPKMRLGAIDSPRQASSSFSLTSPVASTTDTPRALPEPLEQVERATLSPRDRGPVLLDSRSPPLLPHMQLPQNSPQGHPHLLPRTQPLPPFSPSSRTPQTYEPHRGVDPIFPNRDRSRNISDQLKDAPPPATTVANRS
ncbi:hypothetical protein F4820DRAFT_149598 [Hypoxylon rubiginosum]|uniref:Uncharacterized protein n=1 Tax=Hypoxylon rubiginosum TaxID=110542 RepID=A0ACB9ZHT8_9PEZI|nr:hypothetical protein F4820DRAFT_149598 [Hypoxylon rubiginosum]